MRQESAQTIDRRKWIMMPLLAAILTAGCQVSDRSVIQQAQGFDQGIKPAEITDAEVTGYFQQIGDRIVQAARQSDKAGWGPKTHFAKGEKDDWMFKGIQFHLVNSKTMNAFTTGGEHVYIYNELLQLCQNEDELAAVMAHEFGHIYSRHVQKGTSRQYGVIAAAVGLGAVGYVAGGKEHGADYAQKAAGLGLVGGNFAGMRFTRGDEAQADECGFHFYCLAGWDPDQFGNFFKAMIAKGLDTPSDLTSDHPTLASRVKKADERARTMPDLPPKSQLRRPEIASVSQFSRYKQRALDAGRNTPDDKSLAKSKLLLAAIPRSCIAPVDPPDQEAARQQLLTDLKSEQNGAAADPSNRTPAR
jgi:predicted Zn-dependent protease